MRWIAAAILFAALTVGTAVYLGQPRAASIAPSMGEAAAVSDLDMDRIRETMRALSAGDSRISGSPGGERAVEHLLAELRKLKPLGIEVQEFPVAVPVSDLAVLESRTPDGLVTIPLHPLWPNLARTSQTPPEGLTGPLIDVAGGTDAELAGKRIADSIVVMDWASNLEWLSVPEFGGRAVIFRANDAATGAVACSKFLSMPANIPRYYVAKHDRPALDRLLAGPGGPVTVRCKMEWRPVIAKNILVQITTGDPALSPGDLDAAPVLFHAYHDSISVVPSLAPGAEQSCGAAVLLELGRYLAQRKTKRPVYLLLTGGHGQALSGMTHFVSRLREGLNGGWPDDQADTLLARMGRPGLFVGLDLSTRSQEYGVFCLGHFRSQLEAHIRHKFSAIGTQLATHAASFRTDEDARPAFVDCINLTMGRGWWTFFPYRSPFESEIPTLAGFPGITLATLNDDRRYVDTPGDRFDRLRLDLLADQITAAPGRRAGIAAVAEALTTWSGPFVTSPLDNRWARLEGRAVWLDQERNYTPSEPVRGAAVFLKVLRGDKYLMGTRGIPTVLAGEDGVFTFDGLIQITSNLEYTHCLVEAYGAATETFLAANAEAMDEYRQILTRGGQTDTAVPPDGALVYAVDMARASDFPWKISLEKALQHLNVVCFPCRAFSLLGLTDPRGYIPLKDLTILESSTKSPPFQFGQSLPDLPAGDDRETLVTLWADPTLRVMLTLGLGFQEKRLILINNSAETPKGEGFVLEDLAVVPSMVLQGSEDMWRLDESRIRKLESYGVRNSRVAKLHKDARSHLDAAATALAEHDYHAYRNESEKGWALEGKAYAEVLAMINNMIQGILFYLALLLPLSYCLERLVIASETIKKRLIWIGIIFAGSFALLALVHPAFRFTLTPLLVLLAFIILALVITVSVLVIGRMDSMLQQRKQATVGKHEDQARRGGIAIRAVDLGISNIRRRPQRGFLTGLTVVMVTFILLSFTSLTPTISISKLTHPDGVATYSGLLARDRAWGPLPNPLYDSIRRNFRGEGAEPAPTDAVVAARAWFFSDQTGRLTQIDVVPVEAGDEKAPGTFTAAALLCLEPTEPAVTGVDQALLAGRWFRDEDETGVILSLHAAEQLGYGRDDVGKAVRIFGQELPIVGILDGEKFDTVVDVDGERLSPVNFVAEQQQVAAAAAAGTDAAADTLEEYEHYSCTQLVIVPFKFGHRLGAKIRSIAVRAGEGMDLSGEAEGYTTRSNLTILASDGKDVQLYAALDTSQMSAAWQIVIPVFLGFVMILGTMLGSVYERSNEIFVYSSVGLNPQNVSSLFLAESAVYAIIGAGMGYLLGQVACKVMQATGMLSGLSLNYTAGSTVLVTLATMVIVVLSSIYPARKAFRAAIPEADEQLDTGGGEQDTDTIRMFLPFVAAPGNARAMQAYMWEYLDSIQGVSVGQVAVDDLLARVDEVEGREAPTLAFRAWMAPFDLGISHNAELRIVYRPEGDVYQYHLTAARFSGDRQNWRRLTPRFIGAVRKQMLMWRILSQEELDKYHQDGEQLFGSREEQTGDE